MINNSHNAFSVFDRLGRDLEQLIRDPESGLAPFTRIFEGFDVSSGPENLRVDLHEDDDNFYARFEVPGVSKKDVTIELDQNLLTVTAIRKDKGADGEMLDTELARTLPLPEGLELESEKIAARLADGLLTVTLPKTEETKPRHIPVK